MGTARTRDELISRKRIAQVTNQTRTQATDQTRAKATMTRLSLMSPLCAAILAIPGTAQDLVAVKAGTVHTITKGTLHNAVILIENGLIKKKVVKPLDRPRGRKHEQIRTRKRPKPSWPMVRKSFA